MTSQDIFAWFQDQRAVVGRDMACELASLCRSGDSDEQIAIGTGRRCCCGVVTVETLHRIQNDSADASHRFSAHPRQLAQLVLDADHRGREVTMVAHTHPSGMPHPSSLDVSVAWPGTLNIIVSPVLSAFTVPIGMPCAQVRIQIEDHVAHECVSCPPASA